MTESKKVLVVYAHPTAHRSRVNQRLARAASAVPNVEVLDLYETYPDFYIDAALEQVRLDGAATVVMLHPIQWYSMPALLKEWLDTVWQAGWAHGPQGNALRGKLYWLVATTGSPADSYAEGGAQGYAFDDYLPPFRQTARLCGMHWEPPLILHGAHGVDAGSVDAHVAAFTARLTQLAQAAQAGEVAQAAQQ